jgi:predicted alpha/beta-hydrolase family hydrolase
VNGRPVHRDRCLHSPISPCCADFSLATGASCLQAGCCAPARAGSATTRFGCPLCSRRSRGHWREPGRRSATAIRGAIAPAHCLSMRCVRPVCGSAGKAMGGRSQTSSSSGCSARSNGIRRRGVQM